MRTLNNSIIALARGLAVAWLLAALPAFAYDDRVALVIGNDLYATEPLKNAVNDARAMQKALLDLGFKVVFKPNADYQTMRSAAVEFAKQMEGASAAVFYYAGHGIQYSNKNYLVPVDAKLMAEQEIAFYALEVNQILDAMEEAKVRNKFIILDACRNNPFRNLNLSTGLAKSNRVPPGTTISYAAAAGAVALDGEGDNGLYTKHLVREIRSPGLTASGVFEKVGSEVAKESGGRQYPENQATASPRGAFFFVERGAFAAAPANAGVSGDTAALVDREFWSSVKDSGRVEDLQAYLTQFPSGIFATLARGRIDNLKQEKSRQQVAAAPLSASPVSAPPVLVAERAPESAAAVPSSKPQAAPAPAPVVTAPVSAAPASPPPVAVQQAPANNPVARPDPVPVRIAAATPTSEVRGLEPRTQAAAVQVAPPPVTVPPPAAAAVTAPGANQVAILSPEQKSALPPAPTVPKILVGLIEYPNGDRYTGEYKEDKDKVRILHGKGEYVAKNFRYAGDFKENRKQGRGVYTWADGAKFDGDFADDQASGRGRWQFANGDVYEGEVVNAVMMGKGVLVSKNGDRFEGSFINNLPHGQGVYKFVGGDRYEGEVKAGKRSGLGTYVNQRGDRFEVTFVNDVAHGKGVYHFSNGDRYEGEINQGALTGKGEYFHSDGQRSEGNYLNGQLNGEGKFFYNNGSWFEGTFENGLKRAKGVMIQKDGSKRNAEIVDGVTTFPGA